MSLHHPLESAGERSVAVVRVEVALSREHVYVIGAAGIEPIQRGVSIAVSLAGNQSYARGVEIIGAE